MSMVIPRYVVGFLEVCIYYNRVVKYYKLTFHPYCIIPPSVCQHEAIKHSIRVDFAHGICYIECMQMPAVIDALTPRDAIQDENQTLTALLAEFDSDGHDARKVDYLRHRYAGFNRKESGTIAGVKRATVSKWLKEDPRVASMDLVVGTGQRRELRREVLQEEWFRNFYLVLQRDSYVLKKVHGLLEESYLEVCSNGKLKRKIGSPPMLKADWDYYAQMRKMYNPDAWASIEKAISTNNGQFDIANLILNLNQQINIGTE